MQSYERIVEKHKNRLLSNNTGHHLLLFAPTHFSPNSPTFEKKFAKSAFFRKFNKILPRTMQSYERIVEKHKNRLLSNNTGNYLLLIATTHFSPNNPTFEKKFAKSAFFRKCMNACMNACMHTYIHTYIHAICLRSGFTTCRTGDTAPLIHCIECIFKRPIFSHVDFLQTKVYLNS